MNLTVVTHLTYLAMSLPLTVWVAHTLHRHGARFLHDVFHGDTELADTVNSLLVIGWTLINLGYVALYLKTSQKIGQLSDVTEVVTQKVGVIAIVLGVMHLLNVYVFFRMRRRALDRLSPMPPVAANYSVDRHGAPLRPHHPSL